ncbi:Ig-like domain-containing protein [Adhaeribacter radiodurans]|uniref:Ig-like domain-containing protein n=1 Tax=Adhaeribacter radiodurans TaxID=2745197 RepID=A0A7L7LCA0_9BACT|nr:Ig-like domain-containing protein [Adhaeribacter radiodurans]QMU30470.1 Ig-like domain-containing protein [Adhaeribacter radiodurans]
MKKVSTYYQKFTDLFIRKWSVTLLLSLVWGMQANGSTSLAKANSATAPNTHSTSVTRAAYALQRVVSFTLINADNEQPIQTIANGAVLKLSSLPTRNLNIRANTDPATVGSVRFVLSGSQSLTQMQTEKPYALFGDSGGDYYPWVPTNGSYKLVCTPYTGGAGSGTAGTALTISFTVETGTTSIRPYVTAVRPANGATNIALDQSVSVDLRYPGGNYIRTTTVNTSTVKLYSVSSTGTKTQVSGTTVNSTAAGDAVTLSAPLKLSTTYEFQITSGVKDDNGNSLIPFTSRFKTTSTATPPGNLDGVSFTEKTLITTSFGSDGFTTLVIGPDHRLYAATSGGKIERWDIRTDGTITNHKTISPFGSSRRLLIGFHFAPSATASNLIAFISHSSPLFTSAPEWSGKISRINLNNPSSPQVVDYVINLPRSYKDHSTNSIDFGSDGALYFTQGSATAMGSLDGAWGNRPEKILNGAVLRLDITKAQQQGLPVNVKTQEGGTYNPYSSSAPLTIYATGVRNAYDLVWHSNGALYVPTNGSAAGGNTPALPSGTVWSNGAKYTGSSIPVMTDVRQTMNDYLFRVVKGGYYGHPNILRHEFILNGGNPTSGSDPGEVTAYKVGTPKEPNYRGYIYNFGTNKSPNGIIEYKSNAFGGKLRGKMLVCRFSGGDDLMVLAPSSTNPNSITVTEGIKVPGLRRPFANPLDVIEDVKTGNLYLSEYYDANGDGQPRITLLKADKPATSGSAIAERVVTDPFTEFSSEETGLSVAVFPNPSTGDNLHTEVKNFGFQEKVTLTLHDAVGQVIQTSTLVTDDQGAGSQDIALHQQVLRGVYILKAASASGNTQTKVVIE